MKYRSRRDFIKLSTASALASTPVLSMANALINRHYSETADLDINVFSKHLQFLDYHTTGEMAAELGFSGVDLTVRPKGHVLPENVKQDLPKAIKEIKAGGSSCKMITTSIKSVSNSLDVEILKAAAAEGIKYYRTHWYKYQKGQSMTEELEKYKEEIRKLSLLNRELGIIGSYQNHSGLSIGASFWEIHKLLETADHEFLGTQYDIRHSVAEGGHSWENGLRLLRPHIKVISLKDFRWDKVNGKWKLVNVPIGEGMIDFDKYFKRLKEYQLNPPVSMHFEYPLGGAEKGKYTLTVDKKVVYDAMKQDLARIRKLWREA